MWPSSARKPRRPIRRPARRPLLEALEDRALLTASWLGSVGAVGDSITIPYFGRNGTAHNWVEELVDLRGINFGGLSSTSGGGGSALGATGYANVWSGPNTWGAIDENYDGLYQQFESGRGPQLSAVEVGAHDFIWYPTPYGGAPYEDAGDTSHWVVGDIFSGALNGTALQNYTSQVIANLEHLFDLLQGYAPLVAFNISDFSATPALAALDAANPAGAQAYSAAVGAANTQYQALAAQRGIPLIDLYGFSHLLNSTPVVVGGVTLNKGYSGATPANPYDLFADSQHPGTVASGLIANMFIQATDEAYGANIAPLSDQEILQFAGITPPTSGPTYFDVSRFVNYLPPVRIASSSSPTATQAGDPDPSFNGGAPVITDVSSGSSESSLGVAVYPASDFLNAGKILSVGSTSAAAGNLALIRDKADGTPDSSFGSNGLVVTNFPGSPTAFSLAADGRVLVAGQSSDNNGDFALARYLSQDTVIKGVSYHAGDLDPTFGNGGVVTTDFAGGKDTAVALAVDHLGRIIVVGNTLLANPEQLSVYGGTVDNYQDIALARYNPDGTPDSTFGAFGVQVEIQATGWDGSGVTMTNTGTGNMSNAITTDFESNSAPTAHYSDQALAVAIDSQNRILVLGGSDYVPGNLRLPYLLRYNADGQLDTSFDGTGWVPDLNGGVAAQVLAVDASDRAVVAASDSGNVDVLRFATDGNPDATFNGTGRVSFALDVTAVRNSLAIDAIGRIVLGVDRENSLSGPGIILTRLNADGTLDTNFGTGGESDSLFSVPHGGDYISGIALQGDGNIIVGGGTWRPATDWDIVVARYLAESASVPQGTQLALTSAAYSLPGAPAIPNLTFAWSVTGPAGYVLPAGTATSDASFTFTPDLPGTYSISLTVGNADPAGATTTVTKTIVVTPLSSLSGTVFEDFNDDGQVDFGENGIDGVTISLTGTDFLGNAVSQSQQTDSDGAYVFLNLLPGTYTLAETQPAGYLQGLDTVGTAGGSLVATDQFSVLLGPGVNGLNYNFGEQPAATGPVQKGQTAGIGFWNNKNGQALIRALPVVTNADGSVTSVANWLAATLPDIFGARSAYNLAGHSNADVAALFQRDFVLKGVKLDAQVLATALSVYVTNATLDPARVAAPYGFSVSGDGAGTATVNVGSSGDAFGVANNTTLTLMDLLLATDEQAIDGLLYDGNAAKRNEANAVYSAVNQAGGI